MSVYCTYTKYYMCIVYVYESILHVYEVRVCTVHIVYDANQIKPNLVRRSPYGSRTGTAPEGSLRSRRSRCVPIHNLTFDEVPSQS